MTSIRRTEDSLATGAQSRWAVYAASQPGQEDPVHDDELLLGALGPVGDGVRLLGERAQPGRGTDQGIGSGRRGREQLEPPLGPPAGMLGLLGDQRLDVELRDLRHPPTEQAEEHLLDPAVPTQPLPRPRRP